MIKAWLPMPGYAELKTTLLAAADNLIKCYKQPRIRCFKPVCDTLLLYYQRVTVST